MYTNYVIMKIMLIDWKPFPLYKIKTSVYGKKGLRLWATTIDIRNIKSLLHGNYKHMWLFESV